MANQFLQFNKSIANLHGVLEPFVQMTRLLLFLSSLSWREREGGKEGERKRERRQGNLQEAANDQRAKSGRGDSIRDRLREPEIRTAERLQVINGGK